MNMRRNIIFVISLRSAESSRSRFCLWVRTLLMVLIRCLEQLTFPKSCSRTCYNSDVIGKIDKLRTNNKPW